MLRSAIKQYFKSLAAADNKKFWKTVKLLTHAQVSVPVLCAEGVSAVTDREKADMLNNYFAKCWNLSQPTLSETSLLQQMMILTCYSAALKKQSSFY